MRDKKASRRLWERELNEKGKGEENEGRELDRAEMVKDLTSKNTKAEKSGGQLSANRNFFFLTWKI